MAKNSVLISLVAAFALLTIGCGGGSGGSTPQENNNTDDNTTIADTTPPKITVASEYNVTEETNSTILLTATDESNVTFSIPTVVNFSLNNATLTFSAPAYKYNGVNDYNMTVTATDTANNSSTKFLTFHVNPIKAKSSIVSTGDKNLTKNGDVVTGPTGLKWLNVDTGILNYDDALKYCEDANNASGYRMARRDEILNLMNYTKGDGTNASLLEDEFDKFSDKSESWALKVDGKYFYVNFASGADGIDEDKTTERSVLCVKGTVASAHKFVADGNTTIDKTTGLRWTNMVFDHSTRRAIEPDATSLNPQKAKDYCPNGYNLPDIAQLRSIVDYSKNEVNSTIAPTGITIIWSATKDTNNGGIDKNYVLDTNNSIISTEETNLTYFVTCVKKAN